MFGKITAFWGLFRKGSALADCSKSGDKAAISGAVAAFVLALVGVAAAFGYSIPLDSETIQSIGSLAASLLVLWVNGWHVAANPSIGLPAPSPAANAGVGGVLLDAPAIELPTPARPGTDRGPERIRDGKPAAAPEPPAVTNL